MTKRSPNVKIKRDDLIELIEKIAFHHHDGKFLIFNSGKGYKVIFGELPDIEKHVPIMRSIDDNLFLDDALHLALIQQPKVTDSRAGTKSKS